MRFADRLSIAFAVGFLALLAAGCGSAPGSLIDGEWEYELRGEVACANGASPSGTLVIYEGFNGHLTGQYDVCGSTAAANDLAGRITGQRFELELFGGSVGVVDGHATPDVLSGVVTGLGEGPSFYAVRKGARQGKAQGAP